jgi:hypothetical protein
LIGPIKNASGFPWYSSYLANQIEDCHDITKIDALVELNTNFGNPYLF